MKTYIITIIALTLLLSVNANNRPVKIVKTFPCHDTHSSFFQKKLKTIDSLSKAGYIQTGFRVDYTYPTKGYNTQVLTFFKKSK